MDGRQYDTPSDTHTGLSHDLPVCGNQAAVDLHEDEE